MECHSATKSLMAMAIQMLGCEVGVRYVALTSPAAALEEEAFVLGLVDFAFNVELNGTRAVLDLIYELTDNR
jgi:hypothetical protein